MESTNRSQYIMIDWLILNDQTTITLSQTSVKLSCASSNREYLLDYEESVIRVNSCE